MKTKIKLIAVLMVAMMMAVCIVIPNEDGGLDAAVGDNGSYSYTITYDPTLMSTTTIRVESEQCGMQMSRSVFTVTIQKM